MKNITEEIILSLTRQELREFRYFLAAGEDKDTDRRDLQLLDDIRKNGIRGMKNINADHQTKKRLKKKLEQYVMMENLRHDEFSRIHSMVETAKYLFRKNLHIEAWHYLQKAEEMAINADEYRLIDYNYDIQLSYSYNVATHPPKGFSVQGLLQKWQENKALAATDSNSNAAYAVLVDELKKQFAGQLSIDIDKLTSEILERFDLRENVYDNKLRIYCRVVNIICRALREKREYNSLKEYAINSYKVIEKKKTTEKIAPDFIIDLLDMICVAALRSKDYETCEHYTRLYEQQAREMMARPDEYSYYDFIQHVGVADLCLCTDKLEGALQTMLNAQKKYARYTGSIRISFLLRINLIAAHFANNNFAECIRLYNEIKSLSEKRILNEPGFRLELILFSDIYSILFHYEENDVDYALYLLDKFKRKYTTVLKRHDSAREKLFVRILEQLLSNQRYLKSEKFKNEVWQFVEMREFIAGDFEYISMSAWLNSKLTKQPYYRSFLDIVR